MGEWNAASLLPQIVSVARGAAELLLHPAHVDTHRKEGHANFVTNVDLAVQRRLEAALSALLPESVFIGEEKENRTLDERPTWIVDPIDGTTNFMRGRDYSAISIALLRDALPVAACVYQPFRDEAFTASRGGGAFLNGQPMHVSDVPLQDALVGFGTSPYNASLAQASMDTALRFLQSAADIRRTGSAALDLAEVACGRQDVFFEWVLSPWDFAAGALLVEEAGGVFRTPPFEKAQFASPVAVLASNRRCAQEALSLLTRTASGD